MATPLLRFFNARLLINVPGVRGGPEDGFRRQPGGSVLVLASLQDVRKASKEARRILETYGGLQVGEALLSGYVTGWAELTDPSDWRTVSVETLTLNTSGLRHPALKPGTPAALQIPPKFTDAAEVVESSGPYGDEGIGALVRSRIGDALLVRVNWRT